MIIDFHTHCFPDTVAYHALDAMSSAAALYPQTQGIQLRYDGTLEKLRKMVHDAGADYFVQMSVATQPRYQYNVNQFALKVNALPDAFAFGSVHGMSSDSLEELERLATAMGLVPKAEVPQVTIPVEVPAQEPQGFFQKIADFFADLFA